MIWLIGIGGALGAAMRYLIGNLICKKRYPVPLGTWMINISGSFLLGLLHQLYLSNQIGEWLFLFGGVGFCGAFTTFSTFGYETIILINSGKIHLASVYVFSSIILSVISAWIGFYILDGSYWP